MKRKLEQYFSQEISSPVVNSQPPLTSYLTDALNELEVYEPTPTASSTFTSMLSTPIAGHEVSDFAREQNSNEPHASANSIPLAQMEVDDDHDEQDDEPLMMKKKSSRRFLATSSSEEEPQPQQQPRPKPPSFKRASKFIFMLKSLFSLNFNL